jgi:hypothetical protein
MPSDLERALSKLRFDNQVIGYSLMTKGGRPFVSFSFPDELFPRVKDSIMLYKADLRLMTIDTEKGLVVLSPVDDNWILTVLYVPELQLGLAIAKTKNVLRLLEGIELPPPPEEFEDSSESNIQVFESLAIKAASSEPQVPQPPPPEEEESIIEEPTLIAEEPPKEEEEEKELSPEDFMVSASTVPKQGELYSSALTLHSELYDEMKENYRNFAFDVLMLIDGNNSVNEVADSMFQPTERVAEMLKWAASRKIVVLPIAEGKVEETEAGGEVAGQAATSTGGFVKCPQFTGDVSKLKGEDLEVLQHCNGKSSIDEISKASGLSTAKVMAVLGRYRKQIKMIGKPI